MADIIAILTESSDREVMGRSLQAQDIKAHYAASIEDALKLLTTVAAPVILYDADSAGNPQWRHALHRVLELRQDSRFVLASRLADHRMWMDLLDSRIATEAALATDEHR